MTTSEKNPLEHRRPVPAARLPDDGVEANWGSAFYPATPAPAVDEWRPGFWDALVGYWAYSDPERMRDFDAGSRPHRSSDDEDFSSEHGYEPGFEGRSEFEHGEFDRWL